MPTKGRSEVSKTKQDNVSMTLSPTSTVQLELPVLTESLVCYCRVSSSKQRDDLERQVSFMRSIYPEAEIIKDIGSGLNFKRKGLRAILDRLLQGNKLTIIVAHRDRLCRFGFELIQYRVEQNAGQIMVQGPTVHSPSAELTADLLSILHIFSRMHGLRKYSKKI